MQPLGCVPPPSGLVSWWAGDGSAADIAGANHGTLIGGITFTSGVVAQAFSPDGTYGFVTVPHSATLNPTGPFSLEAWINADPLQAYGAFVIVNKSYDFDDDTGWALMGQTDGKAAFFFGTAFAVPFTRLPPAATTLSSVRDGQWHHLAGVFTGTEIQMYLDGSLQSSLSRTNLPANNLREVEIGRSFGGGVGTWYFHGQIDEVSYYNRALSAADINAIYNAGAAGKCK